MPNHIDRGLLVVHDEPDGTITLSICAKVVNGKPTNVYARYHHAAHVDIDNAVALTSLHGNRFTTEIVEVSSRAGIVNVRYPDYDDHD